MQRGRIFKFLNIFIKNDFILKYFDILCLWTVSKGHKRLTKGHKNGQR